MTQYELLQAALALHEKTNDPLLLDAVRVLTSKNQNPRLVEMATACIQACREAHFVLYGTYEPTIDHPS